MVVVVAIAATGYYAMAGSNSVDSDFFAAHAASIAEAWSNQQHVAVAVERSLSSAGFGYAVCDVRERWQMGETVANSEVEQSDCCWPNQHSRLENSRALG